MAFLDGVAPESASGLVAELYEEDLASLGYIANYSRLFSLRPEVYRAWKTLIAAVRGNMRLRRYELATIAAATALRCSYCTVAHGAVLVSNFFTPEQVLVIAHDFHDAGLEPVDVAIMELAQKVALRAHEVTEEDVDRLRGLGLSDIEVFDVVLAAAARSFFSKSLDAMAAEPDGVFLEKLGADVVTELAKGRPFPHAT